MDVHNINSNSYCGGVAKQQWYILQRMPNMYLIAGVGARRYEKHRQKGQNFDYIKQKAVGVFQRLFLFISHRKMFPFTS